MFSGVSKSGSPGPKSITSTPFSFRARASIITARVGETLTAESLCARRVSFVVMPGQLPAIAAKRCFRRDATSGGTSPVTSPPRRATSFTRRLLT